MSEPNSLSSTAKKNIDTISQVEQALLKRRTLVERAGETIARFFGSLSFIAAHVVFFTCWFVVNVRGFAGIRPFDPYPFAFLSLIVGIEFIFLTTFVLLNQKHQIRRNEQWSHLDLQLSMLTEQEVTKNMQLLGLICKRLGVEGGVTDREMKEMAVPTSVAAFAEEIEKSREGSGVEEGKETAGK